MKWQRTHVLLVQHVYKVQIGLQYLSPACIQGIDRTEVLLVQHVCKVYIGLKYFQSSIYTRYRQDSSTPSPAYIQDIDRTIVLLVQHVYKEQTGLQYSQSSMLTRKDSSTLSPAYIQGRTSWYTLSRMYSRNRFRTPVFLVQHIYHVQIGSQ